MAYEYSCISHLTIGCVLKVQSNSFCIEERMETFALWCFSKVDFFLFPHGLTYKSG